MKSLFISYSGNAASDKVFASQLISRLRECSFEPWIFEHRGAEVPPAEEIDKHCKKRIRQADHFISVLSDSSLNSASCRKEVQYALTILAPEEIIQVCTTDASHELWPDVFVPLIPHKRITVALENSQELERCIEDICHSTEVEYPGPPDTVPRLPLVNRLTHELQRARPLLKKYELGTYSDLRLRAQDAAYAYGEGRLEHAYAAMTALEYELSRSYPSDHFYYPRLIKAVLLIELSSQRAGYLDDARKLLHEIASDAELADLRDENLYAAIGLTCLKEGNLSEALDSFGQAHACVIGRGAIDPDVVHNIVITSLMLEDPQAWSKATELIAELPCHCTSSDPYLSARLLILEVGLQARQGKIDVAEAKLAACAAVVAPADVVCRLAEDLAMQDLFVTRPGGANFVKTLFDLITPVWKDKNAPRVLASYAAFLYSIGAFGDAYATLSKLLSLNPDSPKVLVDMGWCLLKLQRGSEAKDLFLSASHMLSPVVEQRSSTFEFFYYRGLAAWLVGNSAQAQRDFKDSRYSFDLSYSAVARRHMFKQNQFAPYLKWKVL